MAFNPFITFQKNKRFWMAMILMICMITFVFFTGGQADNMWGKLFQRSGPAVAKVNGRAVTAQELAQLKAQRNFVNDFIVNCSEIAFKKISKRWHEETLKLEGEKDKAKDLAARAARLARMQEMMKTIAYRKNKPRYFEGGVKLDELLEFKLWQAQADKMGVYLEDRHVDFLFRAEFFDYDDDKILSEEELRFAEMQAMRGARDAGRAFARKAITEEFRVKIAQYAVLGAQPFSYLARGRKEEGLTLKFADPEIPDEVRAPMTLAQLNDYFRKNRALFDVTLLPIKVEDFAKNLKDTPSEIQRKEFFELHKNKAADPSSDVWGLERPAKIEIAYLIADPKAPGYQDLAKLIANLNVINPVAYDPMQSPVLTAARYMAVAQKHQIDLENHHQAMISNIGRRNGALYSERDFVTPLIYRYASKHPEAIASLIGAAALPNLSPLTALDVHGATAGYLACGALKHADELELAIQSEIRRRIPLSDKGKVVNEKTGEYELLTSSSSVYGDFLRWSFTQDPLNMVAPFLAMDQKRYLDFHNETDRQVLLAYGLVNPQLLDIHVQHRIPGGLQLYVHPPYTTETIQTEIKDILSRQIAEEWAQTNIRVMRRELEKAVGDSEKYKRVLNTHLKDLKLTYGPPQDKKGVGFTRFTVQTAPELAPLREAFKDYVNKINWYEARDTTPEKLLKPADFHKMFFGGEEFSATALHRVMIWPPEVKRSNARMWKNVDPRLIAGIDKKDEDQLRRDLHGQDGAKQPGAVDDLFVTAAKPMLYWRTSETSPIRYSDYDKLVRDFKKVTADLAAIEQDLEKNKKNPEESERLNKKKSDLLNLQIDYQEVEKRIVDGWKFERARSSDAIGDAKSLANEVFGELQKAGDDDGARSQMLINLKREVFDEKKKEKVKVKRESFDFNKMSLWHAESFENFRDYGKYPMPKDQVEYPRDDMIEQALSLADLKEPIKIQHKDSDGKYKDSDTFGKQLDEINKDLFDKSSKLPRPAGYHVQILTDKPRSTFYVAFISKLPIDPTRQNADPKAKEEYDNLLRQAFQNARHNKSGAFRDLFVERAQQEHAKMMRADYVGNLQRAFKFEPPTAESRKGFDDRAGD